MQNEAAYSDLIKQVLTKRDSNILIDELDMLKKSLFKTDPKAFEEVLNKNVRKKVADVILFYVGKGTDKKALIEYLDEKFRKLPSLSLTIAFDPTTQVLERIAAWVRQNKGEVVLELKVDRDIVCGAVVTFGGKFYDGGFGEAIKTL